MKLRYATTDPGGLRPAATLGAGRDPDPPDGSLTWRSSCGRSARRTASSAVAAVILLLEVVEVLMVGWWILLHGSQLCIRLAQSPLGAVQAALDEVQVVGKVVQVLFRGLALFLEILDPGFCPIYPESEAFVIDSRWPRVRAARSRCRLRACMSCAWWTTWIWSPWIRSWLDPRSADCRQSRHGGGVARRSALGGAPRLSGDPASGVVIPRRPPIALGLLHHAQPRRLADPSSADLGSRLHRAPMPSECGPDPAWGCDWEDAEAARAEDPT
ncbi:hypothetical protein ON010_g85 [Phytophthora cinnamomi]|nr:hypothetical protein ON010_g85 [Phytophthora cinnamomi]